MEVHMLLITATKTNNELHKERRSVLLYLFSVFVTVNFYFLESFLSSVNIDVTRK